MAGIVPPDLNCPRTGQEIVDLVAMVNSVAVNVAEINNGTDSVAQQALETANIALATAQQALAAAPNKRSSGEPVAIPVGDSAFPLVWSPAMPDTNYEVRLTYYGANVAVGAYYAFRVIDGTRTVNGCQVRLDNTPANTKIAWVVEALPSS